ncbi:hypothetical protein V9L05_04900 [Bernardetia sp. Wsw4-3y2]|uniref:hypothetical protein n=1 Tax=unclassified Bernardetia TaxID=2647129 RepID=UPI0030CF37F8
MKKLLFILFFIFFASLNAQAKARIPIPVCFPCETIDVVEELPDEDALKQDGYYLEVGYLYEEYGFLFISFWNTNGKYVLCDKDETVYYEVSEEDLEGLKNTYNLELGENPLGIWKKLGGKIILVVLIGIGIFSALSKSEEKEEK